MNDTPSPLPPAPVPHATPPTYDSAQLLAVDALAHLLDVSTRTVWRLVERGRFPRPAWRGSRKTVRWRYADVLAWVEAQGAGKGGAPS